MNKYYFKTIVHVFDHVDITERCDEQCPKYPELTIGAFMCSEKCKYREGYNFAEGWIICEPTTQLLREKKLNRITKNE